MAFWNFVQNEDSPEEDVELRIDGEILMDDDFWAHILGISGVDPKGFRGQLAEHKDRNITVWINSPGGDVFAASQIYTALKEHKGKVVVKVEGMAMSAASVIAMSGEETFMSPTSIMMIHNPWGGFRGEAKDLRHAADILDEVKETIINAYQIKSGKSRSKIAKMMDEETWMSAKKALSEGFIDGMLYTDKPPEEIPVENSFMFSRMAIQNSATDSINKFIEQYNQKIDKDNISDNKTSSTVVPKPEPPPPDPEPNIPRQTPVDVYGKLILINGSKFKLTGGKQMFGVLIKAKIEEQEALVKAAMDEKRAMTDEEQAKFNALQGEIDNLEKSIEAAAKLEKQQVKLNTPVNDPVYVAVGKDRAADRPWGSFGEQLNAVIAAARPGGSIDQRLFKNAASGLNESVPSDGGFLVGTDFSSELLKRTYETGALASRCRKIPISATANGIKINAIDESSRANGSRWGGVQAYWQGEADTTTATKPKFRQMELTLNKLMGLCYLTDELMQDTSALESVVMQAFAEEFAFKIDDGIYRGTGAGQILGILNSGALVTVAKEAAQAADTVVAENIIKMYGRMWARSRQNSVWLVNQEVEVQLAQMSLAVGTAGIPVYMPAGGLSASPYSTLYGRPVIAIEQASALGDAGDISLVDLSQFILIEKGGLQEASSIHVRFLYDEQVLRFVYRISGQSTWPQALTPYKGASTQSPFVTLADRA